MTHILDDYISTSSASVIGVLNITPDSFTDGGMYASYDDAVRHARRLITEGADILDIGGESTAPGSRPIDADSELARVREVVATLGGEFPLSIDTYRSATAARCLELGAKVINDVSALRADPDLAAVVREHRALLIMMHAKDGPLPHASDTPRYYDNLILEIGDFLQRRVDYALAAGIAEDYLVVDPGWGRFISLDPADTWQLLAAFEGLVQRLQPIPVMVSTSRKGFLSVPMEERDPLSQLTSLVGVMRGARLIRTHRPRMARQFLDAAEHMRLFDR
ncbi:MAG: dihydropteroate synthase [Pseudomonadota bacterium]